MISFLPDGFTYPIGLIGVLLICILAFWRLWYKKPKKNFASLELLWEVYAAHTWWYRLYTFCIIAIAVLFFVIFSGPYKNFSQQQEIKNGVDIQIVFDLSYSMIATDILPSRIEVAKNVLVSFLGELSQDRVGLILFAGKPFQSVPLTYDSAFLQEFISQMNVETIAQNYNRMQGTAIGDALVMAAGVLTQEENTREKVIVFITDGEANKGIDPKLALRLLKEKNIKTYTIGVGKNEQTTIEVPGLGGFPQKVLVSGVDEALLKKIARETGGKYYKADSKDTFAQILSEIATLEKKPLLQTYEVLQSSLVPKYAGCLLLFLIILLALLVFKPLRNAGN